MVGKVSLADKMRIQTLHEQLLGVKAIMAAYVAEGWQGLGTQNSEGDLPAWVAWAGHSEQWRRFASMGGMGCIVFCIFCGWISLYSSDIFMSVFIVK